MFEIEDNQEVLLQDMEPIKLEIDGVQIAYMDDPQPAYDATTGDLVEPVSIDDISDAMERNRPDVTFTEQDFMEQKANDFKDHLGGIGIRPEITENVTSDLEKNLNENPAEMNQLLNSLEDSAMVQEIANSCTEQLMDLGFDEETAKLLGDQMAADYPDTVEQFGQDTADQILRNQMQFCKDDYDPFENNQNGNDLSKYQNGIENIHDSYIPDRYNDVDYGGKDK